MHGGAFADGGRASHHHVVRGYSVRCESSGDAGRASRGVARRGGCPSLAARMRWSRRRDGTVYKHTLPPARTFSFVPCRSALLWLGHGPALLWLRHGRHLRPADVIDLVLARVPVSPSQRTETEWLHSQYLCRLNCFRPRGCQVHASHHCKVLEAARREDIVLPRCQQAVYRVNLASAILPPLDAWVLAVKPPAGHRHGVVDANKRAGAEVWCPSGEHQRLLVLYWVASRSIDVVFAAGCTCLVATSSPRLEVSHGLKETCGTHVVGVLPMLQGFGWLNSPPICTHLPRLYS